MTAIIHKVPAQLFERAVRVALIGAGGTGSRMLERLVALHRAMVALGHPKGLDVHVIDNDVVSPFNVGRQAFATCDIGASKAETLVNRANITVPGLDWRAHHARLTTESKLPFDLVIGAVDNRSGRLAILRALEGQMSGTRYWLDCGNRQWDGQVVLGQVRAARGEKDSPTRLAHVAELFPEVIDTKADSVEDGPSCSMAEALQKQSLFINQVMADYAANLLWTMFTTGQLQVHGAFINLKTMMTTPLHIDPETWARFGVVRDGKRRKVVQPSRKKRANT